MLNGTKTVIKHKIGLLNLAEELGNVSKACRIMGLSRDTFYRYQKAVEEGGVDSLVDRNRRKPNPKNRVDKQTEAAVVACAIEQPAFGQVRASNELRKRGVFISPSGVRCVWLRNNLSCFKHRLKALEEKMAKESLVLTEKVRCKPWNAKNKMMSPPVKSKLPILATWVPRIRFTWVP
jgi:transposase